MKELKNVDLSQYTTFKIGGIADKVCFPENTEEAASLINELIKKNEPWSIIGGGSNILISTHNIPGTVICTTGIDNIEKVEENKIIAGAGVRLPRLSAYASRLDLSGMEFYEGIPGTVGGAIVMNAGAHGSWTSKILETVTLFNIETSSIETINSTDIKFGYRTSSINPKKQIVLSAKFNLLPDTDESIRKRMKDYNLARCSSQPIKEPSVGCTFSNPIEINLPAGKILDELGAKNWTEGNAKVSPLHANFIINTGNATSSDVCKLIAKLQNEVYKKYKVFLKPEVRPLGIFSTEESKIWSYANQNETNSFIIIK